MSARAISMHLLMAVVAAAFCSTPSVAQDNQLFTEAVEPAQTPWQWVDFCQRHPDDCKSDARGEARVTLTPAAWAELVAVNAKVNTSITPQTDEQHWHVGDRWDYPDDGFGDCEDYALLKRRLLIEIGWPRAALMLAVVWTKQNNGHAVLLVRTGNGEFVLDKENPEILHWTQTGYRFVKRQQPGDPNEWVYVDGDSHRPTMVSWSSRKQAN